MNNLQSLKTYFKKIEDLKHICLILMTSHGPPAVPRRPTRGPRPTLWESLPVRMTETQDTVIPYFSRLMGTGAPPAKMKIRQLEPEPPEPK